MMAFVRFGGIAVFVAMLAFGAAAGLRIAQVPTQTLDIILTLILTVSVAVAFAGTKAFFNAHEYRRADLAATAFVGWFVALTAFAIAENAGLNLDPAGIASKVVDIALLSVTIALSALFGLQAIGFASSGSRVWRVIGTLYLVGTIALVIIIGADFTGLTKASSPLLKWILRVDVVISLLALSASVILHGIALIAGAGRMRTGMAVA